MKPASSGAVQACRPSARRSKKDSLGQLLRGSGQRPGVRGCLVVLPAICIHVFLEYSSLLLRVALVMDLLVSDVGPEAKSTATLNICPEFGKTDVL